MWKPSLAVAAAALPAAFAPPPSRAGSDSRGALPGCKVMKTRRGYKDLIDRLNKAVKDHKMFLVSRASATKGAKGVFDKVIPGNMVVGVYHARYAIPMLEASIPAGIEAPIRYYITENEDRTATLSYKTPSAVFAPYMGGNDKLQALAEELDALFAKIAAEAVGGS